MAETIEAVRARVAQLESQCAQLAVCVDAQTWSELEVLLHEMSKTRHALSNEWKNAEPDRTPEFDKEIARRMRRVLEYRAWQLNRLRDFNAGVSEKLNLVAKWKTYGRSMAGSRQRASALFSDVR